MSVSTTQAAAMRTTLVKPLAWVGIFGAAVLIVFGLIETVSPSQAGNKVINPALFQIENFLEVLSFVGWVLICFAFYQSGATGRGWLAKIALVLAVLGAITASVSSIVNGIAVQNVEGPDWANFFLMGLALFAPVLLGIAAWRARTTLWQALYPILIVGGLSMALWGIIGDANPTIPVIVQGIAWIGFGVVAMKVNPKA